VSISYDRYFIGGVPGGGGGPAGIGAFLVRTEHWAVGLDVGGDARKPRRASDDPILHGWGDIPGTARGGMFASYNIEWLSVHGAVSAAGLYTAGTTTGSFAVTATSVQDSTKSASDPMTKHEERFWIVISPARRTP